MGGNLFKDARRHNTNEVRRKEYQIKDMLAMDFDIDVRSIPCLSEKETHGDLDLIVNRDTFTIDDLYVLTALYPYAINGRHVDLSTIPTDEHDNIFDRIDVLSINYHELQVDLIFIDSSSVEFAVMYHSYNDLGGIIGCITKQLGYSLGREGLYVDYKPIDGYGKYKIYLTKDYKEFCRIFDLDDTIYYGGGCLVNVNDMLDYLSKWKYFNSDWMNPNLMNSTRKNRAAKRKVFNEITELANGVGGIINHETAEPSLMDKFNLVLMDQQRSDALKDATVKMDMKRSFSKQRLVTVLGYEPPDINTIFRIISESLGGPDLARQRTYEMTDDQFRELVKNTMESIK